MKKNIIAFFLVLLISLGTLFPLLRSGFFPVHDNAQIQRVFEMNNSLSDGMLPVRWVENLGYGYGYPIFNFYSPLPYYVGGGINLSGLDSLIATKLMFAIGILLSGISMYIFVYSFYGRKAGILASIIYLYFPYHAVNIYIRGAVGEFYAYAFLPLFFWGIFKLYSLQKKVTLDNSLLYVIISSLSFAFIALSHNLLVFMLSLISLIFMTSALIVSRNKKSLFLCYLLILILGFILSAFFTIPAILEMKYTNVASQMVVAGSNFSDQFVCINQLWDSQWGFGGSIKGCVDGLSFKVGKLNILLFSGTIVSFIWLLKKRKKREIFLPAISIILFLFSIFMTIESSLFLWETIPFMSYIQYPWRFLNFAGLFLSFLSGYLLYNINSKNEMLGKIAFALFISLTLLFNIKLFLPVRFENYNSNHYIDKNNIRWNISKISDEYLPQDFKKPNNVSELPSRLVEVKRGDSDIHVIMQKTGYIKAHYNNTNDSKIQINKAYFPAWKAFINGKLHQIIPFEKGMYLEIPKGEGDLELKFVQTPIEKASDAITLFGFVLMVAVIIYKVKTKKHG